MYSQLMEWTHLAASVMADNRSRPDAGLLINQAILAGRFLSAFHLLVAALHESDGEAGQGLASQQALTNLMPSFTAVQSWMGQQPIARR